MIKQNLAAAVQTEALGVIGGSGLQDSSFISGVKRVHIETPFGQHSSGLCEGFVGSLRIVFIPRHGENHVIPANRINHRANMWALKMGGVGRIISTSSAGSLKESVKPGQFVIPDDFLCFWDIPTMRADVFYPTPELDKDLRSVLGRAVRKTKARALTKGTYVQSLGPRLETRAEISFFKKFGDILGMTMASEATLASELGIRYASLCSVDNYCNGIMAKPLTYEQIVGQQKKSEGKILAAVKSAVEMLS